MSYAFDDVQEVKIDFGGELFEIEDQRNWIDDSFKTFCRPLSLPRPFSVSAGERVYQSVEVSILAKPTATAKPAATAKPTATVQPMPSYTPRPNPTQVGLILIIGAEVPIPVHRVGIVWTGIETEIDRVWWRRLHALKLAHVRIDIGGTVHSAPREVPQRPEWDEAGWVDQIRPLQVTI